jgi:DsbC/DsbD-like thiol-disulfide interchange protein
MWSMDRRTFLAAFPASALFVRKSAAGIVKPFKLALMIADFDAATGIYDGGLDIRLDDGWKTYWRMPGDAGIPPQFNWSGSTNVKEVEVLWPAPQRFNDRGGETIGYKNRVVFPLRIVPIDAAAEVKLELSLFFGVCQDVCIPGNAELSASSGRADPAAAALIAAFAAKVPQKVDAYSPFRVKTASLRASDDPAIVLAMEGSGYHAGFDVFVEGPSFAYFKAPRSTTEDGSTYIVPFTTQSEPQRLLDARLKLTMVTPDIALEQDVTVA